MKKVSVVILNWNGRKLLKQFLPALFDYTDLTLADIVVADNDSTDDSVEFVKNNYPQAKLIILDQNYGFAEGYNRALEQIDTEYTVLLNSDVEVSEGWLEPLIDYLESDSDTSVVQPKIRAQRQKEYFEYAGAAGGFIDMYGYPFCRGRVFDVLEKDRGQYDTVIDIFWASGACFVIRTADYKEVEGLDSSFFAHMEEIDLCWRLKSRGKGVKCIPHSIVYHVGGATLSEESARKTYLNFRNNLLMLYKNMPEQEFKKIFRLRRFLDLLAALKLRLSGKKENSKAVKQAYRDFKQIKPEYSSIRDENQKNQITNPNQVYLKSIIISFYLKKQQKFSDLIF